MTGPQSLVVSNWAAHKIEFQIEGLLELWFRKANPLWYLIMTLTLKALRTSNRWRLIYLDHKPGINLKGAVVEQQLRVQPSLVWCWWGDRDMLAKLKVETTVLPVLCLSPVLTADQGDLITERWEAESQMSVIFDLPYSGDCPSLGISGSQIMVRIEFCFLKCCPLRKQWCGSVLQQVLMYIVPTPETPWVDGPKSIMSERVWTQRVTGSSSSPEEWFTAPASYLGECWSGRDFLSLSLLFSLVIV